MTTWREQLVLQPHLKNYGEWPLVEIQNIPLKNRKRFLRNQHIVAQVLSDVPLSEVAIKNNLSKGFISQLMSRCLSSNEDEPPILTQALIPFKRLKQSQRKSPLPCLTNQIGNAHAFKALLKEVPDLRLYLDDLITAWLKKTASASPLTASLFHGHFKNFLIGIMWPIDRYPYNTTSIAYESLRRYLLKRTLEIRLLSVAKKESNSRYQVSHHKSRVLETVQIDEHLFDFQGRVGLELNKELQALRIGRASLLLAVDVASNCYLGYSIAYTAHPNQLDLLQLLENCVRPWTPMNLMTKGLEYEPGAKFPNALLGKHPVVFNTVQLDNAWMHRAYSVQSQLTEAFSATLHFGRPKAPRVRGVVEAAFNHINQNLSHCFPSTTGSHIRDPKREAEKNRKRVPLVNIRTFEEALSIVLTSHNITPRRDLFGQTPLAFFSNQLETEWYPHQPECLRDKFKPFFSREKVSIIFRKDSITPHINFCYLKYKGPGLADILKHEKNAIIQFDRRDIRSAEVFDLAGCSKGKIFAPISWQQFPHSINTRQEIMKLIREDHLKKEHPLSEYLKHLISKSNKPDSALKLLKFYTEFNPEDEVLELKSGDRVNVYSSSKNNKASTINWTSRTARKMGGDNGKH
jgi:hypothetical protein